MGPGDTVVVLTETDVTVRVSVHDVIVETLPLTFGAATARAVPLRPTRARKV